MNSCSAMYPLTDKRSSNSIQHIRAGRKPEATASALTNAKKGVPSEKEQIVR